MILVLVSKGTSTNKDYVGLSSTTGTWRHTGLISCSSFVISDVRCLRQQKIPQYIRNIRNVRRIVREGLNRTSILCATRLSAALSIDMQCMQRRHVVIWLFCSTPRKIIVRVLYKYTCTKIQIGSIVLVGC